MHPLTEVAYLLSSIDYDCKKMGAREIQEKNLRVRHKKLEDEFSGTWNDIGSFEGFLMFQSMKLSLAIYFSMGYNIYIQMSKNYN
jgi:hypothetical protein